MTPTISYDDDDDDYKDARNRAKPSLGAGVGGGGNEVPAGFVHNPQQELRRVEKARGPNIKIRRAKGAKIGSCQEKIAISLVSLGPSILSDWHDVASPLPASYHHMCS